MATSSSLPKDYLSCPVCCHIYKDPVIPSCSHSFCKACLQEDWMENAEKPCLVCGRRSSREEPPRNLALKEIGEDSLKGKNKGAASGSEAKEKVKTALKPLQEKLKILNEVKLNLNVDETAKHLKDQTELTQELIKNEFKKLHQFLQEEEEARISALKKEEEEKSQVMQEKNEGLSREISTLTDTIRAIEKELGAEDISFLQNYKATEERDQCTLPDPQLVSGALIDVAKHLGNLTFRVWEKIKERVKFTPFILDPNTAHTCLSVSDDLTIVQNIGPGQQFPDNPERNTEYPIVLGSEGFSSGQHIWEVEVGDHPDWDIGVAKESVDRKGELSASPDHGIWVISKGSGRYTNGLGPTVTVKRSLQRIIVQLDYDKGELSFYDPEDMTHIYTYKHTFTEKLYPFFHIGPVGDAKHPDIKIRQSEVSLSYLEGFQPDACVAVKPPFFMLDIK